MKKSIFFLTPILLVLLACAPANNPSSFEPSSETPSSSEEPSSSEIPSSQPSSSGNDWGDMFAKDKVKVYFFESGVKFDRFNPFFVKEYEVESKIENPGTPTSTDPAFNTFIGWSNKPIVMDDSELWNFEEDYLPNYIPGGEYYLYGQWDYAY